MVMMMEMSSLWQQERQNAVKTAKQAKDCKDRKEGCCELISSASRMLE